MKLVLDESLFYDVIDVITDPIVDDFSKETPDPGVDIGVANILIAAINDEWQTISRYNDLIANLSQHPDMIDTIQDIVAEENVHVGQLQKLLQQISPNVENIEKGEEEADQQLGESE